MNPRLHTLLFGLIICTGAPIGVAQTAEPVAITQVKDPAPAAPIDPALGTLLDKIEAADATLVWLNAPIRLIRRFPEIQGGGEHTRYGTIWYAAEPKAKPAPNQPTPNQPSLPAPPLRRFALGFDTLDIKGGVNLQAVRREDKQAFVFDGTWLLETREAEKFFIRRRIVAPGVIKDPVRIGEGPFPLPVGQRKADMLARFDVTTPDPLQNAPENPRLRELLSTCVQLRLVPKVDTPGARDFQEIRLWYRKADLMPIYAQTINLDASSAEVFIVLQESWDKPFDTAVFSTVPPKAEDGWKGDVIEQVQGQAKP